MISEVDGAARDFSAVAAQVEPVAKRIMARYPGGNVRSALIPVLHEFQNVEGWVSPEAMALTAEWIGEPLAVVESTASFYTLFHRRPVGRYMLQPCRNLSCVINGAGEVMKHFRERLGVGHLQTTDDGLFSYEEAECLAACDRAPCMQVNLQFVYDLTKEKVDGMLEEMRAGTYAVAPLPQSAKPGRTWNVASASEKKSPGAQGVSHPNDPGGLGDASGVSMIERLTKKPYPIEVRPTKERLVSDGAERLNSPTTTSEH
ncbi:MAG: NAD(P)H-dependent oxidoreductase subunit E [Candidatus Eremiobacteraeota bacterium]|nr:NAD(P)H-dependent oxidoreductase subunit E [Candidatus Eremiobacteraeota bacterium]